MIISRTIQYNSDRTDDISFILLSYNEENDQKMGFIDFNCRNGAQNRNLHEKLSKTGPVEIFWLWSKSTVNGQSQRSMDDVCWRGSVTSPRANVAGREAQQARVPREWECTSVRGACEARGRYRRRVLVRQKLQPAHGGACDIVSGRSWLGFARDWLFCLSMPFLWQLNA